jgi:hypothetical protein
MKIKSIVIVGIVILIAVMGGCNAVENLTNSAARLILDVITGTDLEGNDGSTTVFSDVVSSSGTIYNDTAAATFRVELMNPDVEESSYYTDAIVDQVDVEYSRTDMTNPVQGIDVPYSFSQKVNTVVSLGSTTTLSFVIVQHNAKTESPLVELTSPWNQEHVLKMEAKCTFHAKDLAGNRLSSVSGSISIWFANFADSEDS